MPDISRRSLTTGAAFGTAALLSARRARAQARPIRIGVLSDMSGPYADASGPGDVLAAQMAVEDFNKHRPDIKVEVVAADMLLKPDIGAGIARAWFDQGGVDAAFDMPQSAVALAVGAIAREKDKLAVFTGAGLADITGKFCSPNHIQWTYDLWSNANAVTRALVAGGADSWFFIIVDYISGHGMADDAAATLRKVGGRELGRVAYPFPGTTDFSSYLLQGKASGARVICLANAGDDTSNCIKQAAEFGIPQSGVKLASLVMQDYIIASVGLDTARALVGAMPFCWTMNADTRAFAARFAPRYHGSPPNYFHAGSYSAVTHYLKAVAAMGVPAAQASGRAVAAQMKAIPVDDPLFGKGTVRPDGKFVHTVYVWQTKPPAESHGPWDFFNRIETIPADQAFRPMAEGGCALLKT